MWNKRPAEADNRYLIKLRGHFVRDAVADKHGALCACIFGDIEPTAKVIGKIIGKSVKLPNVVGSHDSLTFLVNVESVNFCLMEPDETERGA